MKIGLLASMMAAVLAAGCAAQPQATRSAPGLEVERVVMLMRHGIRPPTKAQVTPAGIADKPWPEWSTPYGHLTAHGHDAVKLLGAFDRARLVSERLLPAGSCPTAADVYVWSDSDERTIRTGDALLEGLAPGCGLANGHLKEGETDVLFSPLDKPGGMDSQKAREAILAEIGSPAALQKKYQSEFDLLQKVLGCCAGGQRLADMPSGFADDKERPSFTGPLDFGPTSAQTLMLEYVEGKPMAEVGWGRATRADIEALMRLHAMKGDALQRPAYVAAHGAGPLLQRMAGALAPAADAHRLSVFVGHDTNISDMSGLLGYSWKVDSYPADTPPPGGAFGLQLLHDAQGKRFVRAFYRSQTMDQMRNLEPLSLAHPPSVQWLAIPGCDASGDPRGCPLERFNALVAERLKAG